MRNNMVVFMGGALVGATVGMLFAPRSGRSIRSDLSQKCTGMTHDVVDYVGSKGRHVKNMVTGCMHRTKDMMGMEDNSKSDMSVSQMEAAGAGI
jgi:gas vesicle protein